MSSGSVRRVQEIIMEVKKLMDKEETDGEDMLNYINMIPNEQITRDDLASNASWIVLMRELSKRSTNETIQSNAKAILRRWRACIKQNGQGREESERSSSSTTLKLSTVSVRLSSGKPEAGELKEGEGKDERGETDVPHSSSYSQEQKEQKEEEQKEEEQEEQEKEEQEEEESEEEKNRPITKSIFSSLKSPKDNVAFRCAQFLRPDTTFRKAVEFGFAIEGEIHNLHSFPSHKKEYMNKARQMMLNLKDNEHIRIQVVSGVLHPHQLVRLSTEELANKEQNELRAKARAHHVDAGRTDWRDVNSEKLQDLVGGNVEKEGIFPCYRCKGFHTTYTTAQTRSGDEAETIFIRCLDCGARKKTSG